MAIGATYNLNSSNFKFYYLVSQAADKTKEIALPATLTAAAAIAVPANELGIVDPKDMLLEQPPSPSSNITWRRSGATQERYTADIPGAPGAPPTDNMVFEMEFDKDYIRALTSVAVGTWATFIMDAKAATGTSGIGVASTSDQGTLVVQVIRHNKPVMPYNPTGVMHLDMRDVEMHKAANYHYGPP